MNQHNSTTCAKEQCEKNPSKDSVFFTKEELALLDKSRLPEHIAIIPDGNRRWAKSHIRSTEEGHLAGAETLVKTVKAAKQLGIKVLTVFSFSTENWHRSDKEVDCLMAVYEKYLVKTLPMMLENNTRLSTIGNIACMPKSLIKIIEDTKEETKNCSEFDLILAFNYGGRDEICRAFNKILEDIKAGTITTPHISESQITSYLDTANFPEPDLLIRTSGERRISNFLLWQSSYTELYFEQVTWPDFTPKHLYKAVLDYQLRERRHGGVVV